MWLPVSARARQTTESVLQTWPRIALFLGRIQKIVDMLFLTMLPALPCNPYCLLITNHISAFPCRHIISIISIIMTIIFLLIIILISSVDNNTHIIIINRSGPRLCASAGDPLPLLTCSIDDRRLMSSCCAGLRGSLATRLTAVRDRGKCS